MKNRARRIRQARREARKLSLRTQPELTDACVCLHDFSEHDSSRASSPCARRSCGCSAFRAAAECVATAPPLTVATVAKFAGIELDTRPLDTRPPDLFGKRAPVAPAEPMVRIAVALERIADALAKR